MDECLDIPFRGNTYAAIRTPNGCLHLKDGDHTLKSWWPEAIWNPAMLRSSTWMSATMLGWCRSYLMSTVDADRRTIAEDLNREEATPQDLVELADQLGDMYPTHDAIVAAVRSVGGKPGRVRWASCGADTWRSILRASENGAAGIDGECVRASDYARLLEVK